MHASARTVVTALGVSAALLLGASCGSKPEPKAEKPAPKVDLSKVDDPDHIQTTTTTEATTTTAATTTTSGPATTTTTAPPEPTISAATCGQLGQLVLRAPRIVTVPAPALDPGQQVALVETVARAVPADLQADWASYADITRRGAMDPAIVTDAERTFTVQVRQRTIVWAAEGCVADPPVWACILPTTSTPENSTLSEHGNVGGGPNVDGDTPEHAIGTQGDGSTAKVLERNDSTVLFGWRDPAHPRLVVKTRVASAVPGGWHLGEQGVCS